MHYYLDLALMNIHSLLDYCFSMCMYRHPLQELCVSPFVPNDSCFDLEHGRMKILTGANASGKSVYLKQVRITGFLRYVWNYGSLTVCVFLMISACL